MKQFELISESVEQTQAIAEALATYARADEVIILRGDLGAGKTQFSKGFSQGLGIVETVSSPTFNLVLVYEGAELVLYHFDLYRLERESQLEDIDFFGLIESGGLSLVEWGDRFASVRELSDVDIFIETRGENERALRFEALSERGEELLTQFAGGHAHA